MYTKVHEVDGKWFRDDGTIFGENVKTDSVHDGFYSLIKDPKGQYFRAIHGYVNSSNRFVPLCSIVCVANKCAVNNTDICYYAHRNEPTIGYYIVSD